MLRIVYDNIAQEGDFAIVRYPSGSPKELETSRPLDTAVILSLFTDRRALDSDDIPKNSDRRGFWGDAYPLVENDQWGSRLWTLHRAKATNETLRVAREM
jgi:phage gp46-like protein